MINIRTTILAAAACLVLGSVASGATDPRAAASQRPAPIVKPTPATAAAARAAAAARVAPAPVKVDLPSMTAQQIADRNATARGGLSAWQRVNSMTLTGKLDAGKMRKDGGQVALVNKKERAQAKAEMRKALQLGKL